MGRKRKKKYFENLSVIDAGAKGKAVAKAPDGRVVFIDNAVPGDIVNVQTYKKRKSFYKAKADRVVKYSEKRTEPVCQHFYECGGCQWQNMGYEHQLAYKENEIKNNLSRLADIELPEISPILPSQKDYFYRNKMEFSFSDSRWLTEKEIESGEEITDKNALGFHKPGMWDKVLNLEKCHLQADPSNAIRNGTRDFAIKNGLPFFNLRQQEGFLRTLMIRTSSTGEIMVLLQFFYEDQEKQDLILNFLHKEFPEITSLLYVINSKPNDTIYDREVHCFSGREFIYEEMEGLRFAIRAKSFYQTNSDQAYELYKVVRNFADLQGDERVYDLYTGTGTIAQFIAKDARKIIGVEAVPDAIDDARKNAKDNGIENAEFYVGDMKKVFKEDFVKEHGKPDVVITDPPREGMHKKVVQELLNAAPERIVYVSCKSATQARDLDKLDELYRVSKIQPVDMFPQTHHIENVVCLEKRIS